MKAWRATNEPTRAHIVSSELNRRDDRIKRRGKSLERRLKMSKRRKHDELWLLELANQMIGKIDSPDSISRMALENWVPSGPCRFFCQIRDHAGRGLMDEVGSMSPATLGSVVSLALGEPTPYRLKAFIEICSSSDFKSYEYLGGKMLVMCACVVIAGAMWEILAAERVLIFRNDTFPALAPTPKMIEFVRKVRNIPSSDDGGWKTRIPVDIGLGARS